MRSFARRGAAATTVFLLVLSGTASAASAAGPAGDGDGDGLRARRQTVDLASGRQTVDLTGAPELVILDDIVPGTELSMRSRNGGTWSEWIDLTADDEDAPDGRPGQEGADPSAETAVGPVWIGHGAEQVEIVDATGADPSITVESLEIVAAGSDTTSGSTGTSQANATSTPPFVLPRSTWATSSMGWATYNDGCGSGPSHKAQIKAMVVHHTAGTNGYAREDVPAILRAIWSYHVNTRGWCDIAYNFLVDRFGRVWEGRQGGITEPIIGGHTYGFNTDTSGVAQMGNFDSTTAPDPMTISTERLIGWKLALHGVDPSGRARLTNRAPNATSSGIPSGATVDRPAVIGHRDLGSTSCPGSSTYSRLPRIRGNARTGAHLFMLHRTFLGTTPTDGEYAQWAIRAFQIGLAATVDEMAHSDQYAGRFVNDLYRRVLGRDADSDGMRYWLGVLRDGTSYETVAISFYGSDEHYRSYSSPEAYVDSLYDDLLHRASDDAGRTYWAGELRAGASPAAVVYSFYRSIESRRDRVTRLYRSILGRDPDPSGRDYWADVLLREDDLVLSSYLALSDEYYAHQFA